MAVVQKELEEWISVENELPQINDHSLRSNYVLIWREDTCNASVGWLQDYGGEYSWYDLVDVYEDPENHTPVDVSYWMKRSAYPEEYFAKRPQR